MGADEKVRVSGEQTRGESSPVLPTVNPAVEKPEPPKPSLHPAVYVLVWMSLSSGVILFNKWILDKKNFHYPVILTTWHLTFSTIMTQIMARTTNLLDGRKTVKMTGRVYLRAICPIGLFFSLSLVFGNLTYIYLSVSFIQMLKATTAVCVLIAGWLLGIGQPNVKVLFNVSFIVIGVMIASFGEIEFNWIGFTFQIIGLVCEAIRLVMVQKLLSSAEFKMDPLVSLYYFAPICAAMNFFVACWYEFPKVTMAEIENVGFFIFIANAMVAFMLNISVVFLIGKTSSLVMTLCGVLKDIILVFASMILFGNPVTLLQFFGYSIALGGLVYYKLGADQLKGYFEHGGRVWAEYGNRHPALRKMLVFGAVLFTLFLLLGGLAPTYAPEYDPKNYLPKTGFSGSSVGSA